MFMTVSVSTAEDGMFVPETAEFSFKYRPDGLDVRFLIDSDGVTRLPTKHSVLSKLVAVTYAPNPEKRLPANITFDLQYKIVVTGEKVIRCSLLSAAARKGSKTKTLDKTHEVFRKIRKSCMLIPICFVDASMLSMSEAKQEERKAEKQRKIEAREAEKLRKLKEQEEARARKKAEQEALAAQKEAEKQRAREEKKAKQSKLSESDKKRIKATAL